MGDCQCFWIIALRSASALSRQLLHRFGSLNPLVAKNCWSRALNPNSSLQVEQMSTRSCEEDVVTGGWVRVVSAAFSDRAFFSGSTSVSESFLTDFLLRLKPVSAGPARSARTAASVSRRNMAEKVSLAAAAGSGPRLSTARRCICFVGSVQMHLSQTCLGFAAEYAALYLEVSLCIFTMWLATSERVKKGLSWSILRGC